MALRMSRFCCCAPAGLHRRELMLPDMGLHTCPNTILRICLRIYGHLHVCKHAMYISMHISGRKPGYMSELGMSMAMSVCVHMSVNIFMHVYAYLGAITT